MYIHIHNQLELGPLSVCFIFFVAYGPFLAVFQVAWRISSGALKSLYQKIMAKAGVLTSLCP